ncbi:MAG: tripartite tricarboxylate transporter substrate binding protein [Syntrophaceae bacterium]|nr:tripartite tricarboxylate transporter substrate binding protein [Syntrophaceae bacterium]
MVYLVVLMVSILGSQFVGAQDFPTRPVVLVIPFGAGGSHDLTARAVTSVAADYLGQPILVQLKPGGGGAIASEFVYKAAPDGYTLLFGGTGPNTTLPAIENRSKGPDDFVAVCRVNYSPAVIVARPNAPFKTFKEMLTWAKANPGKLIFGNTGPWGAGDLSWKMIVKETGIEAKNVPHDGGGPALVAVLGGHVDVSGLFTAQTLPHIQAGKLRALAVTDTRRDPSLKDVPTCKEEGVNVVYLMWRGVLAPKGTPRAVVDRLAAAFKRMCEDKSVINMINKFGDEVNYLGPDEFAKVWREEFEIQRELGKIFKK